jgi:hypothetical protein
MKQIKFKVYSRSYLSSFSSTKIKSIFGYFMKDINDQMPSFSTEEFF